MIQLRGRLPSRRRGFEIDTPHIGYFSSVIECKGWQFFYNPPKATAMTIVCEFYANAHEMQGSTVMVQEKQVNYTAAAINNLQHIQAPHLDDVMSMDNMTDLDEVSRKIYKKVVRWTMVRGTQTTFLTKELESNMKIQHYFIYARLVPTIHLTEVTRERALLLYDIKKNLSINVGLWMSSNIRHKAQNVFFLGLSHSTLITKLIAESRVSILGQELLQPKNPLNRHTIERIMYFRVDLGGTTSSQSATLAPTKATIIWLRLWTDSRGKWTDNKQPWIRSKQRLRA